MPLPYLSSDVLTGQGGPFVQWAPTPSLDKGIAGLHRMYAWLPEGSPLKLYIEANCLDLHVRLVGDSPLPLSMVDPVHLMSLRGTVPVEPSLAAKVSYLRGASGVYAFLGTDAEGSPLIHQVGSCLNFPARMTRHMREYRHGTSASLYLTGMDGMFWSPLYTTANHLVEYRLLGHLPSPEERLILTSYTQQWCRSLEQAVSTHVQPLYYDPVRPVTTWHNGWQPGHTSSVVGRPVVWTGLDGVVHPVLSLTEASLQTGSKTSTITNACDGLYSVNTKLLGPVTFVWGPNPDAADRLLSAASAVPVEPLPMPDALRHLKLGFDFDALVPGSIYVMDENLELCDHGPYSKSTHLIQDLGVTSPEPRKRVNNMRAVTGGLLAGASYYLIRRDLPMMYGRLVVATDLHTGEVTTYPGIVAAADALGDNNKNLKKSYVDKGKVLKTRDGRRLVLTSAPAPTTPTP